MASKRYYSSAGDCEVNAATYQEEGRIVLVKGGADSLPKILREQVESDRPRVQEYCNTSGAPPHFKTQAFKRATEKIM